MSDTDHESLFSADPDDDHLTDEEASPPSYAATDEKPLHAEDETCIRDFHNYYEPLRLPVGRRRRELTAATIWLRRLQRVRFPIPDVALFVAEAARLGHPRGNVDLAWLILGVLPPPPTPRSSSPEQPPRPRTRGSWEALSQVRSRDEWEQDFFDLVNDVLFQIWPDGYVPMHEHLLLVGGRNQKQDQSQDQNQNQNEGEGRGGNDEASLMGAPESFRGDDNTSIVPMCTNARDVEKHNRAVRAVLLAARTIRGVRNQFWRVGPEFHSLSVDGTDAPFDSDGLDQDGEPLDKWEHPLPTGNVAVDHLVAGEDAIADADAGVPYQGKGQIPLPSVNEFVQGIRFAATLDNRDLCFQAWDDEGKGHRCRGTWVSNTDGWSLWTSIAHCIRQHSSSTWLNYLANLPSRPDLGHRPQPHQSAVRVKADLAWWYKHVLESPNTTDAGRKFFRQYYLLELTSRERLIPPTAEEARESAASLYDNEYEREVGPCTLSRVLFRNQMNATPGLPGATHLKLTLNLLEVVADFYAVEIILFTRTASDRPGQIRPDFFVRGASSLDAGPKSTPLDEVNQAGERAHTTMYRPQWFLLELDPGRIVPLRLTPAVAGGCEDDENDDSDTGDEHSSSLRPPVFSTKDRKTTWRATSMAGAASRALRSRRLAPPHWKRGAEMPSDFITVADPDIPASSPANHAPPLQKPHGQQPGEVWPWQLNMFVVPGQSLTPNWNPDELFGWQRRGSAARHTPRTEKHRFYQCVQARIDVPLRAFLPTTRDLYRRRWLAPVRSEHEPPERKIPRGNIPGEEEDDDSAAGEGMLEVNDWTSPDGMFVVRREASFKFPERFRNVKARTFFMERHLNDAYARNGIWRGGAVVANPDRPME